MSTDRKDRALEGDLTPGDDLDDVEIVWVDDDELSTELSEQARGAD